MSPNIEYGSGLLGGNPSSQVGVECGSHRDIRTLSDSQRPRQARDKTEECVCTSPTRSSRFPVSAACKERPPGCSRCRQLARVGAPSRGGLRPPSAEALLRWNHPGPVNICTWHQGCALFTIRSQAAQKQACPLAGETLGSAHRQICTFHF